MSKRQHGVAIVLAMGVVALAALTATAMMVAQSTWSRQIELTAGHAQAQFILQAGLDWARAVLSDDHRATSVDHLGEPWALRLPPIPVENGSLVGQIEDQQARFNLNNLQKNGKVNPVQLASFRRLLTILAMPQALADALADWINAGGRPLIDVAELASVNGFDDGIRARLRPFVSALPRLAAEIEPLQAPPPMTLQPQIGEGVPTTRARPSAGACRALALLRCVGSPRAGAASASAPANQLPSDSGGARPRPPAPGPFPHRRSPPS